MDKKLLLIGGGGHCKSVIDSLLQTNEYDELGIIDKKENIGRRILDVPIIGCDGDLNLLQKQGFQYAFVTLGSVGDPFLRIKLFNLIELNGFAIPNIIDPSALISRFVKLETGIFIGKNVTVNTCASIGKGSIINTSSIIEHDCEIGEFSHLASGAVLCGGVKIGENSHIGASSTVKQQVKIGANSIIGMGSVVLKDIGDNRIAYGNPCKEIKAK